VATHAARNSRVGAGGASTPGSRVAPKLVDADVDKPTTAALVQAASNKLSSTGTHHVAGAGQMCWRFIIW
jgi:hypothetical protein